MAESLTPTPAPRSWRQYPFAGITAIWLVFLVFAVTGYIMTGPIPFNSFHWKADPQQRERMLRDLLNPKAAPPKLLGRSSNEVLEILGQPDRFLAAADGGATFVYRVAGSSSSRSSHEIELSISFEHNKVVSVSSDRSD